jgi:lysophosphatidate acyltransferase
LRISAIWHRIGKVTVIAKRGLLYAGTFGLAAWLCGLVFIDKKARDESKGVINKAFERLKEQKIKLWMFPEGKVMEFQTYFQSF